MKVSIYEDKPEEVEREYKLKLFQSTGGVILALADKNGDRICSSGLVIITNKMKFVKCENIDRSLGFPLDGKGSLKD